jgi:hypothetical protein
MVQNVQRKGEQQPTQMYATRMEDERETKSYVDKRNPGCSDRERSEIRTVGG